MSVSMYSNQVDRINDDLANLRGKLADERKNSTFATYAAARRRDGGRAVICRDEGARSAP